jgi:superfamily II DNA/RNA helicase
VGRTARAESTGEAFTFVSPEEEGELKQIEKAIGRQLPRVTVPGFDYAASPAGKLEVPLAERIANAGRAAIFGRRLHIGSVVGFGLSWKGKLYTN